MKSIRVCGSGKKRCPACWDMLRLVEMRFTVPSNGSSGHVQLKVEAREAAKLPWPIPAWKWKNITRLSTQLLSQ